MKKLLIVLLTCTVFIFTTNTGCVKSSNPTNPVTALPDVADFLLSAASTFVAGAASTISIHSSSLGAGAFTVHFDLSGANTMSGLTAALNMSGNDGTFQTPTLPNAGNTNINITSITNSSGGSANITTNNTFKFTDSTGLLTCSVNGKAYRALDVHASLAGSMLTIHSVYWDPLATVTVHIDYWNHAVGTTYFNSNDLSFAGNNNSTFNGAGVYNGTSILPSQHGMITISSITSSLITGTFSFTAQDSSIISSGNFSCPAP
jgi:hypothetical protein